MIRALQRQTEQEEATDEKSGKFLSFRLSERKLRRFYLAPDPRLPNVHPVIFPMLRGCGCPAIESVLESYLAYTFHKAEYLPEGIILLRNHLSVNLQKRLIKECLHLDNASNLTKHYSVPRDLWNLHCSSRSCSVETLATSPHLPPISVSCAVRDIRWKLLGKNYDWSNFSYTPGLVHHIPDLISTTVLEILDHVGLNQDKSYVCEAGIVNFYGLKDSLMGHQVCLL